MSRMVLTACVPWLALLLLSFGVLLLLARVSRARLELGRLRQLHADQVGSAQSLSFVLALPLFIMVLMFIVQVSQLMIGQIVVEYAAVAAARAAVVWIPARIDNIESWNRVAAYDIPDSSPVSPPYIGPQPGGKTHVVAQEGEKYARIRMAAVLACVPISPSRRFPGLSDPPADIVAVLERAYAALSGRFTADGRFRNKLAYALSPEMLNVDVGFWHSNEEHPLAVPFVNNQLGIPPDATEYRPGQEIGWQDPVTITVTYNLALLPGPGRLLATRQGNAIPVTGIRGDSGNPSNVFSDTYTYSLSASATMGNEGEKPMFAHYRDPSNNP